MSNTSATSPDALKAFLARPAPLSLEGGVQIYGWGQTGDKAFIPNFLGRVPEPGKAYAEFWIGDHPVNPSKVLGPGLEMTLPGLIRAAPEAVLGARSRRLFGDRLPFLVKVLAAEKSLSLQAHPTKAQAEEGFAREEAAGVPRAAPDRNYKDENHKPEILVALTDFHGLSRFRPLEEIAAVFESEAPELQPLMPDFGARLKAAGGPEGRRALMEALYREAMSLSREDVNRLLTPLVERLKKSAHGKDVRAHWVLKADGDFSRGADKDRGLISIYFLNLVKLVPGQAMYQAAGELHAYLEGVGVEVMANSDNVLRGGLTPKHVDIPELMKALTFSSGPAEVLAPDARGIYKTPARDFEVAVLRLGPGGMSRRDVPRGADVLLAAEGVSEVRSNGAATALPRGRSLLVPAGAGAYEVHSRAGASLYRASVPIGAA